MSSIQQSTNKDQYFKKDLLHFKPLTARAIYGIQIGHAALYSLAPESGWQGRTVKALISACMGINYMFYIPIALIESISLAIIGTLGGILHCVSAKRSQFLEKFTVKCFAHSINSFAGIVLTMHSLSKVTEENHLFPSTFVKANITEQYAYLASAALAHFLCAYLFRGEDSPKRNSMSILVIQEGLPNAIKNILYWIEYDSKYTKTLHYIDLHDFYTELSDEERLLLQQFDFLRIFDSGYLHQFLQIANKYLEACGIDASESSDEIDEGEEIDEDYVELNIYTDQEQNYQNHLMKCVQNAVNKIIKDGLVKYLSSSNDPVNGKELLMLYDSSATIPLANIAQLIELNNNRSLCPEEFKNEDLKVYNSRRAHLKKAQEHLKKLSKEDHNLLIEHLIRTSDFQLGNRVFQQPELSDQLFKTITMLAGDLHKGKLMNVLTYNQEEQNFSSVNYFGKAWSSIF